MADVLLRVHRSYLAALRPVLGTHPRDGAHHRRRAAGQPESRAAATRSTPSIDTATLGGAERSSARSSGAGQVPRDEMYRAFNMGVGMVVDHRRGGADAVVASAAAAGVDAWRLGRVAARQRAGHSQLRSHCA